MKSIFYKSLALVTLFATATSCSDDVEYVDTTPSAVTSFYEPVDGKAMKLVASNAASLLFEWEPAHATDGVTPQYEVAFYKADDTKNPIYKVTSDNNGAKPLASVSHKILTKVMAAAGVGMGEEGTIKWGVISYSGVNSKPSTTLYDLTLTRFIGFDEIPTGLYIVGEGTETGTDLSQALAFAHPDAETFELFTKLSAGKKFYFSADRDGLSTYSVKGSSVVEGEDGGTYADADGVYRISIDFSTASISMKKIDHVYMRFTDFDGFTGLPSGQYACEFAYQAAGVYAVDTTIKTMDTGWPWDPFESRHNFYMEYADGTACTWGPVNAGNDGKPGGLDITSGDFTMVEYAGKVSNKWKLPDAWYDVPLTYYLYFNNDNGAFKHFAVLK